MPASSCRPGTYREVHQDLFTQIASQLAVILEKSRLYRELVRLNDSLHETMDALERLAEADGATLLRKLGVRSRVEAAVLAVERGLCERQ